MGWWASVLAIAAIWALFAIASELEGMREILQKLDDEHE